METWRNLPITEKQREFIKTMQEFVDECFTGTTRGEAADYINRNIELFKLYSADSWCLEHGYF